MQNLSLKVHQDLWTWLPATTPQGILATKKLATILHSFIEQETHGMACILDCFMVESLLVAGLPGGKVTVHRLHEAYTGNNRQKVKVSTLGQTQQWCSMLGEI